MDLNVMLSDDDPNWVNSLPGYQRSTIQRFLETGATPEEAAARWLNANGPMNTFPFGGVSGGSVFYEKLVEEVEAFVCGGEQYNDDRKRFLAEFQTRHAYVVGGISAAIAPTLGTVAPLVAPAVALTLLTIGRITLNAWCASRRASRSG